MMKKMSENSHNTYFIPKDISNLSSFSVASALVDNLKNKMKEIIKKIKNNEFDPLPGHDCEYCDFKDLCSVSQE